MRERSNVEWSLFLLALQYLTRLPVPPGIPTSDDLIVRAAKYYPLVGAIVGLLAAIVLGLASLWLPTSACVILAVGTALVMTSARHENGLARAVDGLLTFPTPDDNREGAIGIAGIAVLCLALGLKVALLGAMPAITAAVLLVAGHVISRAALVQLAAGTPAARDAEAAFPAQNVTPEGVRLSTATGIAAVAGLVLLTGPTAPFWGVVVAFALVALFRRVMLRQLGGFSGHGLGATQQLAEIGLYLGVVAAL